MMTDRDFDEGFAEGQRAALEGMDLPDGAYLAMAEEMGLGVDDTYGSYPGPCTDPGGHEWPHDLEESDRCLCIHCGADGDA